MKQTRKNWSRRDFLAAITVAGAGTALLLNPLATWAANDADPRIARIVADTMGIDAHNHVDVPLTKANMPGPNIDIDSEMKRSGLSAICMTFALDYQQLNTPGEAYDRFLNGLTEMDSQLARNGMKRSLNLADLQAAHARHQPTVIQSVEGAHFLEGHIDRLQVAYDRGLRHLGLLHDSDASVPLGDVFTNPVRWGGLTVFGAEVIKKCNRLGILVDLSHANEATVTTTLKIAAHPVLVSHTGLNTRLGNNPRMAQMMMPRLISKEHAKFVAGTGSVIGVWTHLSDTPLDYAENIRAMVDVVGIDHVCIGTDTKLTPSYRPPGGFGPMPADFNRKPVGDSAHHQDGPPNHGGPGDDKDHKRPGERTNEAWADQKTGFYYAVVDAMLKTGFNAEEIGKIGGGNFCRVFGAATIGY